MESLLSLLSGLHSETDPAKRSLLDLELKKFGTLHRLSL